MSYADKLALPCAEIFRRLCNGYDSGKIGIEGDQLTKARCTGLLRKLGDSMELVHNQYSELIATDPRRAHLLTVLGKLVTWYATVSSFELVNGSFHMHWHGGRVLASVRFPLGLGVSSTLLGYKQLDASVPNFNTFEAVMEIDFAALRISLLDQMLYEGRLSCVAALPNDERGCVDAHALLRIVFVFLDEKEASGDVITRHHCVALRAEHEWLENVRRRPTLALPCPSSAVLCSRAHPTQSASLHVHISYWRATLESYLCSNQASNRTHCK